MDDQTAWSRLTEGRAEEARDLVKELPANELAVLGRRATRELPGTATIEQRERLEIVLEEVFDRFEAIAQAATPSVAEHV